MPIPISHVTNSPPPPPIFQNSCKRPCSSTLPSPKSRGLPPGKAKNCKIRKINSKYSFPLYSLPAKLE